MPRLIIPNHAGFHTALAFLKKNNPFVVNGREAELELHSRWAHMDPFALSLVAAWGGWCKRQSMTVRASNIGKHANYAARMKLFHHLGINYNPGMVEYEEAGRFLPLTQVQNRSQLTAVIANVSALLHLESEPDALAAVQYCVSELIRNVLEHSGSLTAPSFVRTARREGTKGRYNGGLGLWIRDCGAFGPSLS